MGKIAKKQIKAECKSNESQFEELFYPLINIRSKWQNESDFVLLEFDLEPLTASRLLILVIYTGQIGAGNY